jgi:hypothetical protein
MDMKSIALMEMSCLLGAVIDEVVRPGGKQSDSI